MRDAATGRVIEIDDIGRRVTVLQGSLAVTDDDGKIERVPLDDIAGVIDRCRGFHWSGPALAALSERGVGVVACDPNHNSHTVSWPMPRARYWPPRIGAQLQMSPPLARSLWRRLLIAGIEQKLAVLREIAPGATAESPAVDFTRFTPERIDAFLERRYWTALAGESFRRDTGAPGDNAVFNFGRTRLRVTATGAVHAAGLHPGLSLRGRAGPEGLVDDLMLPYAPVVDLASALLVRAGHHGVNELVRLAIGQLFLAPLAGSGTAIDFDAALKLLALSLGRGIEAGDGGLTLPLPHPGRVAAALRP